MMLNSDATTPKRTFSIRVGFLQQEQIPAWDGYVLNHPEGNLYHLSGWASVIRKTYGHKSYYLIALRGKGGNENPIQSGGPLDLDSVVGVLPLINLKHFFFGNRLVSLPFFDFAGVLGNDEEVINLLRQKAMELGEGLKVEKVELRHLNPPLVPENSGEDGSRAGDFITKSEKVRMMLPLPDKSDTLLKSLKSKLRSQIQKPLKEGLTAKIGGSELLPDFYEVFSTNMRDLGSPVHSPGLMRNVLAEFPDRSRIFIIYRDHEPLACSLTIGFRDTLENPWASSLRKFSHLSPNMLLYWTMLAFGCDNGYSLFDFGRSTRHESTYKFKEQWGAKPTPLYWQVFSRNGKDLSERSDKASYEKLIAVWSRMPLSLSKWIGPGIRKHIDL
jgi:serine/alanine adding enzyme